MFMFWSREQFGYKFCFPTDVGECGQFFLRVSVPFDGGAVGVAVRTLFGSVYEGKKK
jgi:hypothetical protein